MGKRWLTHAGALAPVVSSEEDARVLRLFHAANRPSRKAAEHPSSAAERPPGLLKHKRASLTTFDTIQCIAKLNTESLTDTVAERMALSLHMRTVSPEQLLEALMGKLQKTVESVSWNHPQPHPEWISDMRFYGQCWLVVRSARRPSRRGSTLSSRRGSAAASRPVSGDSTSSLARIEDSLPGSSCDLLYLLHEGKEENQYAPLMAVAQRSVVVENQFIADAARRLGGQTFRLTLFHLSGVFVAPDRMHVLIFDGFRQLCLSTQQQQQQKHLSRASPPPVVGHDALLGDDGHLLSTLSFSSCRLGSAGLLILVTGLVYLLAHHDCSVSSLDLSYNELQSASLYCLAHTLRFTAVRRLSLRGNVLRDDDSATLRDFLLEGCGQGIEELDLSHTGLSNAQVSTLMDCLPHLQQLRVLLLEEICIPTTQWPAFARAVEKVHLWHVRLYAGAPSSVMAGYASAIDEICARNRQLGSHGGTAAERSAQLSSALLEGRLPSFFEAFFLLSRSKGAPAWRNAASGLPDGYDVFTDNDPSLRISGKAHR